MPVAERVRRMLFNDRAEGGRVLASRLAQYSGRSDVLVLGLPRGGVPVAFEIARALEAPLDVFVVRPIGAAGNDQPVLGAIASGGVRVLDHELVAGLGKIDGALSAVGADAKEWRELERRERAYRNSRPPLELRDRVILLVDDGLATGSTMKAAVRAVRAHGPSRVLVAVPVGAPDTCRELEQDADEIVCAREPDPFVAVGQWYHDFSQTTDEEVRELLNRPREAEGAPA
jgi:predicted phosphoribosyltransferase